MNLKCSIALAGLILAPGLAAAADAPQNYFGIGYDGTELELATDLELDMHGFNFRYGFWLPFDLIAIELRVGTSAESTDNIFDNPEIQYVMGLGKVNLPFETVNLYAMGGVSKFNYDFAGVTSSEDDIVAGIGIELLANETTGLTIEYLRHGLDDAVEEVNVLTVGFNHRFELPGFR